ncbi:MAG TPA: L,D-transpeptidase, partial [Byssovorax sp.]
MFQGRALAGAALACAAASACAPAQDPPGRTSEAAQAERTLTLPASGEARSAGGGVGEAPSTAPREELEPGHGAKIASIAMRTWIYVAPREHSTKLGYLRAGAVVDRGDAPAGTDGCAGGWYRVAPRGYV